MTPGAPSIKVNGKEIATLVPTSSVNLGSNLTAGTIIKLPSKTSGTDSLVTLGPYEESATMALECLSVGGRPAPDVRWFNGTRQMRAKISHLTGVGGHQQTAVLATVRFIISRYDLGVKFTCRVSNNATEQPMVTGLTLDVHGKFLTNICLYSIS